MRRRRFLKGLGGVAVGLPLLESLDLGKASAQDGGYQPYAVFIREANGFAMATNDGEPERFLPSQQGAISTASLEAEPDRAVSLLAPYAAQMSIVRGVNWPGGYGNGCGHADGGNLTLTAARVSNAFPNEKSLPTGESIDNLIARKLHPGTEPLTLMSGRSSGYLNEVLSYSEQKVQGTDANQRRAAKQNPLDTYNDLFGLSQLEPEALERLKAQRKSVNDLVRSEMQALMSRSDLSQDDHSRLQAHFDAIRDLEVNMACNLTDEEIAAMQMMEGEIDNQDGDMVITLTKMHMDVLALALACGAVRSATLQIGHGNDHTEYWINGVRQPPFHWISHRLMGDGDEGDPIANADALHGEIDRIHVDMVKYLLDRLSGYSLGSGTLLDSGVVVFTNDLSNKYHSFSDVPHVLVGSCNGFLRTGQYIDAGGVTNNKMLNTIATAVGVRKDNGDYVDDFGQDELEGGLIDGLLA